MIEKSEKSPQTRVIFLFSLLLLWYVICKIEIYPPYLLPSPSMVLNTLKRGFLDGAYFPALFQSSKRVLIGYFTAVIVGSFLGLAISRFKQLSNSIGESLTALQSIPSVAWVPLALLWFGISESAVLFIVILEAFIPCSLGVQNAIKNIPPKLILAGRSLGCESFDLYKRIIIPAILPQLISSLRLSWAFAWRALIAGELFINGAGLGQTLELGRSLSDMSEVIAMMLIIAIIGYVADNILFRKLEESVNHYS
ncbi:MAG: ABC transporter permease [bacterium]